MKSKFPGHCGSTAADSATAFSLREMNAIPGTRMNAIQSLPGIGSQRVACARMSLVAGVALLLAASVASAQYPSRNIRIISPAPPGGSTDIVARLVDRKSTRLNSSH